MSGTSGDDINVAIRVRPLIERELKTNLPVIWKIDGNTIRSDDPTDIRYNETYTFDHIFGMSSTNKQLHDKIIDPLVVSCAEGYNCTIFTYGQTSSGKTHTMDGSSKDPGIIPRVIDRLFQVINGRERCKYLIRVAYVEIYNERVYDLLNTNGGEIKIREDVHGNIAILAKETVTSTKEQIMDLMKVGKKNRKIHSTKMNINSSRSHTIFRIIIECSEEKLDGSQSSVQVSHFNLVDLAGSERVAQTKATGQRLIEGSHINKSLSTLALVISQLADQSKFINYRDSKLTLMLKNSLGGNAKTLIVANVTPASLEDTHSTLSFAKRAKTIKNKPTINTITSGPSFIRQCQEQILRLQNELKNISEQNRDLVSDNTETKKTLQLLLEERIKLITKAFVSPRNVGDRYRRRRHTIGGGNSMSAADEFHNIINKGWEGLSTPLTPFENSLLQVVRSNCAQTAGDSVTSQGIALPFEAQVNLAFNIDGGGLGLDTVPEEDLQVPEMEYSLADFTVNDLDLVDEDEECQTVCSTSGYPDMGLSGHRSMGPFMAKPGDMSFETLEFQHLEAVCTSTDPEELTKELQKLRLTYNTLNVSYTQQTTLNKVMEEQNRCLLDDIASLTRKLNMECEQRKDLEERLIQKTFATPKDKYDNLLKEMDKKDEEYFKLLNEKTSLEKKCKEILIEVSNLKLRSPTKEKVAKPETSEGVQALTLQVRELQCQLVDQEEVMNQLTNKYKRREEELLRRLEEKEGPHEKLFSEIMKTERPVQACPETEDDMCQTDNLKHDLSIMDTSVQTEDVNIEVVEDIPLTKLEVDDKYCQSDEKLIVQTVDIGCQVIDIDIEDTEDRDKDAIIAMQQNIVELLTTEQSEEELAKEQQVLICILQFAKETLETCSNKFSCLQELRENMSTTEESLKEAYEKITNLIHLDMQNARLLAQRAPRSAKLLNHLLSEINQYRVSKDQEYDNLSAQLAEQISDLRADIDRLKSQLYNEQLATKAARNEYNKSKAEVALLKDTLHRMIPATTEKQILKDISETVTDLDEITHENVLLNKQLEDVMEKVSTLEDTNTQLVIQLKNVENKLADKTGEHDKQLKKQQEIEIELIRIKSDLIDTALQNDRLKIMLKQDSSDKPMEGVSIHFDEADMQELPSPTIHDKQTLTQIWRENNQLKARLANLADTVEKQCTQMAEYEKRILHLKRASEEKDRLCEEESLHVRVTTKITIQEMEAKMQLLSDELASVRMENQQIDMRDSKKDLQEAKAVILELKAKLRESRETLERTENMLLEACEDLTTRTRELDAFKLNYKHNKDESLTRLAKELSDLSCRYQTQQDQLETMRRQHYQNIFYKDYYKSKCDELNNIISSSMDSDQKLQKSKSLTNLFETPKMPTLVKAASVHKMGVLIDTVPLEEIVADLTQLQCILNKPLSSTTRSLNQKLLVEKSAEILKLKAEIDLLHEELENASKDKQQIDHLNELMQIAQEKTKVVNNELETIAKDNIELTKRVEILTEQLRFMSANLDSYVEQHEKLTRQKTDLLAGNAINTETIKTLQENVAHLEEKLSAANSENISLAYNALEAKLKEQQNTYDLLAAEYQRVVASYEKQLQKNFESEAKIEAANKRLAEQEQCITSLRNKMEVKVTNLALVESDKQVLDMKVKQLELTLQEKQKLEVSLQQQLITFKTLNEELRSVKSRCDVHTEENKNLRTAVQELQQLKKQLEQKFDEMRATNINLTEQCKILRQSSCREEYEALKQMYTEEMKTIREDCYGHLEQNRSLMERVNQLEKLAAKPPTPKTNEDMLHEKELQITKLNCEFGKVESKLKDTTKELRRIQSRCVCEGRSPTSSSLEARRLKKSAIQDSQRHLPCSSCSTLTEKVKQLEGKICYIESQHLTAPKESDLLFYQKCLTKTQAEKIDELTNGNKVLTTQASKLEMQLAAITKEKEYLLQKLESSESSEGASAAAAPATYASLEKECKMLRGQLEELTSKYERVKAIARKRAKQTENK